MLVAFGGHMSIEAFRAESETYSYASIPPNCVVSPSSFLKFERAAPARTQANKFLNVSRCDDTLRLPTNKGTNEPVAKGKNKRTLLEAALGL